MQALRGIRVNSFIFGLCWLLAYLASSISVHALPSQLDYVLPSEPVDFVTEQDLLRRDLLPRDNPELEAWDIYQKYQTRKERSTRERLPSGLSKTTTKAERQSDPQDRNGHIYTYGDRTLKVRDIILGRGGDGVVYKGSLDETPVAVKFSSRREIAQAGVFMVALRDSPYVLRQLALLRGEDNKFRWDDAKQKMVRKKMVFQVTPLMDASLGSWLATAGDDDWQKYHASIAHDALQGLVDMHDHGIAHRDYKLDNILVQNKDGNMHAVIADLDRSTRLIDTLAAQLGTPGYTPYEYMVGPSYNSAKADVFSAAMSMMGLLFKTQSTADPPPTLGWTRTLWKAILDAQNPKRVNLLRESAAQRIKRKVLLHKDFADLLPGMTKELADVFSKALCPEAQRLTSKEFMDQLLPLLPFDSCS